MSGRLLSRLDPHGLREHIEGHGLLPRSEFAIAAKTMHILQEALLPLAAPIEINIVLRMSRGTSMQNDSRDACRESSCALGRDVGHRAVWCDECKPSRLAHN